ncbi:signal peptide peptidase SppA [Halioxenophilus sp. WMMB6]|uniref:signal peptide peptidase SppA n=1 Tax=Halioxenophilus sp. WMMB6 TaxID=3073815 RepID=UPI00295EB24D|nr:signal peptide peptidase SppA [Halioxenophilus sp. WMMB6]
MSQRSPGILRRLFGGFWNLITWLRVALLNLIFLLLLIIFIASLWPAKAPQLGEDNLLVLAPSGLLVDEYTYIDPLTQLLEETTPDQVETLVSDLVTAIDLATEDKRITAMAMDLDSLLGAGISKMEEVGVALERFKAAGKPIYAYGSNLTQQQYYLASYADEIHLNPLGAVLVTGFATYRNYFKETLDKLAVSMHIFRAGEYKDAMEPFMRNDMSQASKENNQLWLDELWGVYSSRVEEQRNLPKGALNDFINTMDKSLAEHQGDSAKLALDAGLVDQLSTRSQFQQQLAVKLGTKPDDGLTFQQYLAMHHSTYVPLHRDRVAVITARGLISQGEQPSGETGDESFLALLQQVQEDTSIKALVIRLDSGGGGVQASENIRLGLVQLANERPIPIVISMGSIAASGAYWIATAGDEIWATPTTITGSIGVFGAFATFEKSLDKIGVSTDGLSTTALAGAVRADRELSPMAEDLLQQGINHMYSVFLGLVADARNSSPEEIDKIAQGRVWSGNTALELGLVDRLGNLEDVIARAAELAELDHYEVQHIIKPLSPMEQFLSELNRAEVVQEVRTVMGKHQASSGLPPSLVTHLQSLLAPWQMLDAMNDPRASYAMCLVCLAP